MIDSLKLIRDLSNAGGISGFEDEISHVVKNPWSCWTHTPMKWDSWSSQ